MLRAGLEVPATVLGGAGRVAGKVFTGMKGIAEKGILGKVARGAATGATFEAVTAKPNLDEYGKDVGIGALTGGVLPIVGKAVNKTTGLIKRIGDEILNTTLGLRLSEYGRKVGFENIPKYLTETVPRDIVQKLTNFFPNATKTVGSKIDSIINSKKYSNFRIDIFELQDTSKKMELSIDDFDISTAEKKILKGLVQKLTSIGETSSNKPLTQQQIVSSMKQRWMSLPKLWNLRKEL